MAASERHHRKMDPASRFTLIFLFLLCIPGIYGRSILNSTQNLVPELPGTSVLDAKAAGSSRKPSPVVQLNSAIAPAPIPLVNEIICESIIVMNFVENFDQIGNCTVIEGHLKIILIDFPEKSYDTLSFPNLREVTDFVLIYRVSKLRTLKNIFPNLAVIRGQKLIRNNALVIFENNELEEIGLIGLTRIVRGSVYIWRNNLLCYVDTVNWKALTDPEYEDSNSIRDNKPEDQCANQCPANLCSSFFKSRQRDSCWTDQDCQKSLQPVCENGNKLNKSRGSCCHTHCLSGCFGNDRNECLVCRDVHFQGVCHSLANGCPANSFMIHGRRCVNRDVCRKYKVNGVLYKVHEAERTCVAECPPGYTVSKTDPHICNKCNGSCPKVCKGNVVIDSVAAAQTLTGCTIINGSLEIQIGKGEKMVRELDSALQNIEEIRDYLKVVRSHALLSLSFFKRLRLIRGENLPLGQYALNVIDNQNLQDLWEFTPERPSLQIGRSDAKIGFHFNPQLCRSKIDVFVRKINSTKGIDDYDEHDISKTSNGDRAACDMKALDLRINSFSGHFAQLTWESFNLPDPRSLLGYVVFYRESPAQNLSKFEGRDACGTVNVWTPIDVTPIEGPLQSQILYDLRPATQYGVYITTYTVASEKQSAQSDIQYFTTKSKQPSMPTAVRTESLNSTAISVHWKPPKDPNGVIAFYRIRWQRIRNGHRRLAIRDYCNNPIQHRPLFLDGQVTTTPVPILGCNGTDGLGKPVVPQSILDAQKDYEEAIKMENEIQDSSYTQRVRSRRAVREEDSEFFGSMELPVTSFVDVTGGLVNRSTTPSPSWTANTTVAIRINKTTSLGMPTGNSTRLSTTAKTTTTEKPEVIHVREIHEGTSSTIIGLDHFTEYLVSVEACQARSEDINYDPCSGESQAAVTQTLAKRGADDIPSESVKIKYLKQQVGGLQDPIVAVNWTDPEKPNGVIVTVEMELINLDRGKQLTRKCVPRTQEIHRLPSHQMEFGTMHSGNYSFRLRASSFAGNGSWTAPQYVYVEQPIIGSTSGVSGGQLAGILCGICGVFFLIVGIYLWRYKPWIKKPPTQPNFVSVNPDYYSYTPDEWEVPRDKVKLIKKIGSGSFGEVFLGEMTEPDQASPTQVAVKTVDEDKSPAERNMFLQEASRMKYFRSNHVVRLIGVVSEGQPIYVIMELMHLGDLKTYLRLQRPDAEHPNRNPPTFAGILQMAAEICDGMAHIHSRKIVHRDLAARNCLINADLTVKIGDFGMSRDVYETDYYRKAGKGLLPVRWMAPESLRDGLFNNESDVWSFGVVLWEIVTLAEQPYQGLSNEETLKFVIEGNLMPAPEGCNEELHTLMLMCWQYLPKNRPTFLQLVDRIINHPGARMSPTFLERSYYKNAIIEPPEEVIPALTDQASGQVELQEFVSNRFIDIPEMDGPGATGDDESEEPVETDQLLVEPSAGDAATRTLRSPTHHPPPFSKPATPVPLTKSILSSHHKSSDSSIVDGLPLEPNVVVKQNGTGSQVSSAENSRSMALTFPLLSSPDGLAGGAAAATAAGHRHVGSNGSVTNGHHPEKTPRTMY